MSEPIESKLLTPSQVAMARLQDAIVEAIYEVDAGVVMHGGTAIWRCYGGNRFSYDVDIYLSESQLKKFRTELTWKFSKHGIKSDYPLYTDRVLTVFNDSARTKLEAMKPPKGLKPVPMAYERVNGTKFFIKTLSVDSFVNEKMSAYGKRKYARDLYDVYQLVMSGDVSSGTRKLLLGFLKTVDRPKDIAVLKDIVYTGVAPGFDDMINAIRGRLE